jgi:threonyl-tRNA synthetase
MLIVGEKEKDENTVSVRKQGEGDIGTMSAAEFAEYFRKQL